MNFRKLFVLMLVLLITITLFSQQQDVTLLEGDSTELCNVIVNIKGFWIDNYELRVDISTQPHKTYKPLTRSYKNGDTIYINEYCKYYVVSILKYGMNTKGKIVLSTSPKPIHIHSHRYDFMMYKNENYQFDNEKWFVQNVFNDSALVAIYKENLQIRIITLKKDDVIWFGEYAFSISNFTASEDEKGKVQEKINLKMVKDYSYLSKVNIYGELLGIELIIRKMRYYPKMRIDEEEFINTPVKYWVLKIFHYPTGIVRPVTEVIRDGKKMWVEYEPYKSFDTEEDVMEFARINKIADIKLHEE